MIVVVIRTAAWGVVEGVLWNAVDGDVNSTVRDAVWNVVNDRMIFAKDDVIRDAVRDAVRGVVDYGYFWRA